jgi:signal transduction histidine kinase
MLLTRFLHARTDRLDDLGRAAIAVFALAAVWFEPSQPILAPDLTYGLISAYLAFAVGALLASRFQPVRSTRPAVVAHLVDLSVVAALMFLTDGPASPFFVMFTYSLVSSTVRWQWKGALWTSIAVIVLLAAVAAIFWGLVPQQPLEIDRFIMRCAQIIVTGSMLVYLGFRYQRMSEEAGQLAAWHPDPRYTAEIHSLLELCLRHVAEVMDAPRVLLVLDDGDEPWLQASSWDGKAFRHERLIGDAESLVAGPLADSGFIMHGDKGALVLRQGGALAFWHGTPLGPLPSRFNLKQTLSVPIHSDYAAGRLFASDRPDFGQEHLVLANLLAAQIAIGLGHLQVIATVQRATAMEERVSIARDLHDGLVQSLAGTALQLATIRDLTVSDPATAAARIDRLQAWLTKEQRELRNMMDKLQSGTAGAPMPSGEPTGIADLAGKLEQHWGIAVDVSVRAAAVKLPARLEFDIHQIVREAVSNAVRHGGATVVTIDAHDDEGRLLLCISDNGSGLARKGRFDMRQCADHPIGPRSVFERVSNLGGSLILDSRPTGLELSIELPVDALELSR